jgi:2-polyprenyl-6-methoxyphenol hydroxylase-like FAD-dependent oxidoreductase
MDIDFDESDDDIGDIRLVEVPPSPSSFTSLAEAAAWRPTHVIVGAGPVGLWTAFVLLKGAPGARVVLLEKYAEYRRRHVLRVSAASVRGGPACAEGWVPTVSTATLESDLKAAVLARGAKIVHHAITKGVDEVCELLGGRELAVVVGADGSHSACRADPPHLAESLQCVVDAKYSVRGRAQRLRFIDQTYPTLKLCPHVGEEHVGKVRPDGTTPITVRFLISRDEYKTLAPHSTFKHPLLLESAVARQHVPADVLKSLLVWLNARSLLLNEEVVDPPRLTVINLSVYRVSTPLSLDGQTPVALVGDAAAGVPYFRALNMGLVCGTRLGTNLAEAHAGGSVTMWSALRDYRAFFDRTTSTEIASARVKQAGLRLSKLAVMVNGGVPWQVNAWRGAKRSYLLTHRPDWLRRQVEEEEEPTVFCSRCRRTMTVAAAATPASCAHGGSWHSSFSDCTLVCAGRLTFGGLNQAVSMLGYAHYPCCGGTDKALARCPSSPAHDAHHLLGVPPTARGRLPPAIRRAVQTLTQLDDHSFDEGLFRLSPPSAVFRSFLADLDAGHHSSPTADAGWSDQHCIASLIKAYLRSLDPPIAYPASLATTRALYPLLALLRRVIKAPRTRMTAASLGICFGPSLAGAASQEPTHAHLWTQYGTALQKELDRGRAIKE